MQDTSTVKQIEVSDYAIDSAELFADKIGNIINSGAISVMISLGHRTGLFDTLATLPASTSLQIARKTGLSERYVREWLAAMVVSEIVVYDANQRLYSLPPEHAACLTQDAPLGNLAVYAQFIPMSGAVQEKLLENFQTGEGSNYEDYPCFHQIMSEDSKQTVVAPLFEVILPLVPGLIHKLDHGISVLDAGCGSGYALIELAKYFPKSQFTGYDISYDAISRAWQRAAQEGLENIQFEVYDLSHFNATEAFDLVLSFDAIHDQKDPQALLCQLYESLKSNGVHLMQDIGGSAYLEKNMDFPFAGFLYTASCMHCVPISLGQNGEGLGTMWGWETAKSMLQEAKFQHIEKHILPHDPMNVWFVSHKTLSGAN